MSELTVFENSEFGAVRTVTVNGEPWFVGKDIAEKLGYQNGSRDVNRHVDHEDRSTYSIVSYGQSRDVTIINESGLYSLVLGSKLDSAKRFKRWITSEVIPSIRKSGGYIAGQENMSDSELLSKALLVAQRQIEQKNARIEQMRPKEIFADAVSASSTSILVGDLAKMLRQNGVDIGQNRLFDELRRRGYLIKSGERRNMPTQTAMEKELFQIKETAVNNPDGSIRVTRTTKVTGKGQQYFINLFLAGK